MIFHDYTLNALGEVWSHRVHDTATLSPAAVQVFRNILRPEGFQPRPVPGSGHIHLEWSQEKDQALATFYSGPGRRQLLTHSALAIGHMDTLAIDSLWELTRKFNGRAKRFEPKEHPVIVTVPLPVTAQYLEDMALVADMETCVAAAWFEVIP